MQTSQVGALLGIASRSGYAKGLADYSILQGFSHRLRRAANSTLLTEACACVETLDEARWLQVWMSYAQNPEYRHERHNTDPFEIRLRAVDQRTEKRQT
eukprot:4440278-Amphidinium_carterae.1